MQVNSQFTSNTVEIGISEGEGIFVALKDITSIAIPRQTFTAIIGIIVVFSPLFAAKQLLLAYFLVWLIVILVLNRRFCSMRRELAVLSQLFLNPNSKFDDYQSLPELKALTDAVKHVQRTYSNCLESRHRVRDIIDQCPLGIIVVNEHGDIEMINQVLVNILSGCAQQYVGRPCFEVLTKFDGAEKQDSSIWHALNGIETINKPLHRDGVDWIVNVKPIVRNGKVTGAVGVYQDVTETAKAIRERAAALESFASVFNCSLPVMALINAEDMTYLDVNSGWENAFGYSRSDVVGKTPAELGLADCQTSGGKMLTGTGECGEVYELSVVNQRGESKHVVLQPTFITDSDKKFLLYVGVDVTKLRRFEQEIAQLDRLSLVGELAASIGHEVRNPLTTVRGYLQLFQCKEQFAAYQSQIGTMIEEIDRANSIISEFLSLAKSRVADMKLANINSIIQTLFPLMQADAYRRGYEICLRLGDIPDSELDEKQIRQLLLNLVRNGLEAMTEPGAVTIATELAAGSICLSISDSGSGIPDEILSKLGTPFVSTKEHGTGLGLPVCYRVAEQHKAKVHVATSTKGTTFTIQFPA